MKKELLVIFAIFLLFGCGNKKDNPAPVTRLPGQVALSAPAQNSACTNGTVISTTISTITFIWNPSNNTDSYMLVVKNLLTSDSTTQNTTQTQQGVNLLRNTPYSWYVISESADTKATSRSTVWKFYNSGPGVVTYAPFPADITSPTFDQNISAPSGTVNLAWQGSVVAPDAVASYDVYFGTTTSPALTANAITNNFLNNVKVSSNTIYYWKVITRDINGNTSDSGLFQFSIQ